MLLLTFSSALRHLLITWTVHELAQRCFLLLTESALMKPDTWSHFHRTYIQQIGKLYDRSSRIHQRRCRKKARCKLAFLNRCSNAWGHLWRWRSSSIRSCGTMDQREWEGGEGKEEYVHLDTSFHVLPIQWNKLNVWLRTTPPLFLFSYQSYIHPHQAQLTFSLIRL